MSGEGVLGLVQIHCWCLALGLGLKWMLVLHLALQ
jgi:hypothetical protein